MNDRVFVDTYVLVCTRDASESTKQKQAMEWMTRLWSEQTGGLSFRVLNEFYATVTDKLQPGMDAQSAREDVPFLLAWRPIPVDALLSRERGASKIGTSCPGGTL